MHKVKKFILSTLAALMIPVQAAAAEYGDFTDLQSDWYTPYVDSALDLGLMTGTSASTWEPDTTLNRAMAATIIYRMGGQPNWMFRPVFTDVKSSDYFAKAVSYGEELGIIHGYNNATFRPLNEITRQDLVKLIYEWAKIYKKETIDRTADLSSFPDGASVAEYAKPAMSWAYANNVLTGDSGYLKPEALCTRAQAAKFFTEAFYLSTNHQGQNNEVASPEDSGNYTDPDTENPDSTDQNEGMSGEDYDPTYPDNTSKPDENQSGSQDQNNQEDPEEEDPDEEEYYFKDPVAPGPADDNSLLRNVKMYGIDISYHNQDIDLSKYKGQFVMIRGGYWNVVDEKLYDYVAQCEKYGIPYGIYWYSYALDTDQAITEANACLQAIRGTRPTLGVWFDMEDADGWKRRHDWEVNSQTIGPICEYFCKILSSRGYHTGIYTSASWQKYLVGCGDFDRWIAHWGNNNGNIHYDYSSAATLYQYTSRPIDKNVLYVPLSEFQNNFSTIWKLVLPKNTDELTIY